MNERAKKIAENIVSAVFGLAVFAVVFFFGYYYRDIDRWVKDRMERRVVACHECNGTGKTMGGRTVDCIFCKGEGCSDCKKTGKLTLDNMTLAQIAVFVNAHLKSCKRCTDEKMCLGAWMRLHEIVRNGKDRVPVEGPCPMCGGRGKVIRESEGVYRNLPKEPQ